MLRVPAMAGVGGVAQLCSALSRPPRPLSGLRDVLRSASNAAGDVAPCCD